MMKLLVVVVGLLFLVPDTMQLSLDHPVRTIVERLNVKAGSYLGIVISSSRDENTLTSSTYYEPDANVPFITLAGRQFNIGKFSGQPVIYVLAGEPLANVGATVQLLLELFRIKGVISYGSAGTISNQVFIADVVIPSQVAFTSVWNWKEYDSEVVAPALTIGEYNVPKAGENSLDHIEFRKSKLYTPNAIESTYWIDVHSEWVQLASQINFGDAHTVHIGGSYKVGSSDIYVNNVAYATFLNKQLNVTAVDTASAAVVATSIANGVPHIVIRGTSNRPGTQSDERLSEVTSKNVLKTVAVFIESISPKSSASFY